MLLKISPYSLAERDLVIRPFIDDDHVAEVDGLRAGWILHASASEPGPFWWWSLTGPCCTMGRVEKEGRCNSLEEAKRELSAAYARWLRWALSQDDEVTWFASRPHNPQPAAAPASSAG